MATGLEEILHRLTAKQRVFIKAYLVCGSIASSSDAAKITRTCHYAWIQESEDYKIAFNLAKPIAIQSLEDEAIRRAQIGCDEPVFYQGVQCGTVRKYSDSLMALLLKGHKPDTYKDRSESTVKADLEISKHVDLSKLSTEQLGALSAIVGSATTSDREGDQAPEPTQD